MKKLLIIVISIFIVIIVTSIVFYNSLYNKQMDYMQNLLSHQVQIVGISVDTTNNGFLSDLNQIVFSNDNTNFFTDQVQRTEVTERMKLFFSKYQNLVTGIKYYDNNKNEFSIKKDETGNNWLEQTFVLHVQGMIYSRDQLVLENRRYEYLLPVFRDNIPVGNLVVTVDFEKYFNDIFLGLNSQDYLWQWVVSDSGQIIYNNGGKMKPSKITVISEGLENGLFNNLVHNVELNGKTRETISSYYSAQLLQKNIAIVFSSPTDVFQKYIVRNSILMGSGTLLLFTLLVLFFWRKLKSQNAEIERLSISERMLFRMIEEMPAGVIIHDRSREILKANKAAAEQYSYSSETDMVGKIFPEPSVTDESSYFSKYLGGKFNPSQFVIIKKEIGEVILFRSSFPLKFRGKDAVIEMLIDVTSMESARKQEAKANSAKSEFLARMSYEIRTPLNGIIGMTDILGKQELKEDSREIVNLLRRSAEVLLNIINDILDFSKIETGKMILDEIPCNLREEIVYCYDLARSIVDESQVRLLCSVDDDIPDKIIGDPFRFRQILTNLLNHSIENTSKGQIILKCSLKENSNGKIKLGFELSDTGKAFDKATFKKLLGDYVNVESKVHQDDDGSGFGTILARQLIELMGGTISAVSPSGLAGDQGSKIVFTISVYSNEKPVKNLHFDEITTLADIKTLVITGSQARDEEILGTLHKLGLSMTVTNYQKSTVSQITANLSYSTGRYHLVVILGDREFSGFKAAEDLWKNNLSSRLIIMIITSNDVRGNLPNSIAMGVDHYLVKPYEMKELYDIVRSSFPEVDRVVADGGREKMNNNLKILVVEDNKMNQKVIGTMLKSLGYSFDFADDGFTGYIQAKTRRYDVIFMDLIMPQMDGFESARRILDYDNNLLIVAFTADNMPDSKRKAELSGIKEFIPKPVRIGDLKKFFSNHFPRN